MGDDSISVLNHLEKRLDALERIMVERLADHLQIHASEQRALQMAAHELSTWKVAHNDLMHRMDQYHRIADFLREHQQISDRIDREYRDISARMEPLAKSQTILETKASQSSVAWSVGIAIMGLVVALLVLAVQVTTLMEGKRP